MPSPRSDHKRLAIPLLVSAGVLFLDQTLKLLSCSQAKCQKNYGALFGWQIDFSWALFALIVLPVFLLWQLRGTKKGPAYAWPPFLLLAGIISNLLDRLRLGYIIDYLNLSPYVFNLADLAILLGAGFLIWKIIRE